MLSIIGWGRKVDVYGARGRLRPLGRPGGRFNSPERRPQNRLAWAPKALGVAKHLKAPFHPCGGAISLYEPRRAGA
jgi:hypothetical protein